MILRMYNKHGREVFLQGGINVLEPVHLFNPWAPHASVFPCRLLSVESLSIQLGNRCKQEQEHEKGEQRALVFVAA